ncbi:MAG: alpha/beta hydrolase [Burkholderiales bacterium]|jgi:alpha-beta hydrolase superfamily lysophospholipase|nr:alpha/beta hydrolase [Burkholderiales bacterium]
MKLNLKILVLIFAVIPGVLFVAVSLLLVLFAPRFFYYPERGASHVTPASLGLHYEDIYFQSQDGTKLNGWLIFSTTPAKATVVLVHGNAGKLENHLATVAWLPQQGYNVFMFDYRGFGLSDDVPPAPKPLMEDTRAAIATVKNRQDLPADQLLVLGQSLGGNNAIAAVGLGDKKGIKGMVIDSTFYAYSKIAGDKFLFARYLVSDTYSASRLVNRIAPIPMLFIHGTEDTVITDDHTKALYEASTSPKKIIIATGEKHVTALLNPVYQKEVLRFFDDCLKE